MSLAIENLPTNLMTDDGEPMESNNHRISMNLLIQSLKYHWRDRSDFFVGGNMFVYYSANQVKNQDFKGPDFFVVLDVDGTRNREAWIAWEEDSHLPDVVIELMSPSTAEVDLTTKKDIYERNLKTQDYFVHDPNNANYLRGWTLINRRYQSLSANDRGRLYCQSLGLWLGLWQGKVENSQGTWLRFFDTDGNLVLMRDEAETQRADFERSQKEKLAAKLRELGINPDEI